MKARISTSPVKSNTILDGIVEKKKESLEEAKRLVDIYELKERIKDVDDSRGFHETIRDHSDIAVVAEIKAKSPSAGVIAGNVDPEAIAAAYQMGGAAAISVLTEEDHFGGSLATLPRARERVTIPVLRKDFIFESYQLYESRAAGADAVLLITAILDNQLLAALMDEAYAIGLDCLVEVHTESERDAALWVGAGLIGVNNRDLKTFITDLSVTERIMRDMPTDVTVISASGVSTGDDVRRLVQSGARGVLVGESLMRSDDIPGKLAELIGGGTP